MSKQIEIISKNLASLRIANKMTQLEVSEKLGYSDKTISKWERGEALPDILMFMEIAKLYHVKVSDILSENMKKNSWVKTNKKIIIPLISFFSVWLLAILAYVLLENIFQESNRYWLVLIYASPVSFLVLLILNFIFWGKKIISISLSSVFLWTLLIAIYLTWTIKPVLFWLGVPAEIIIWLVFFIQQNKNRK